MYEIKGKRQRLNILVTQLKTERESFLPSYRDLGEHILPQRPRFTIDETNRGDRRNQKIIDSTATMAARTLRSGMMSGLTNPARPWFRLTTPDPALAEMGAVKEWLHHTSQRMNTVFTRSNLYQVLPVIYGDIGVFGTGAMLMEEDFESVLRFYPFPVGSYMISNNDRLQVDVFAREFKMTVRQLVSKFAERDARSGEIDWSNFSTHVRSLYERGNLEEWIEVCHVIEPNDDYDEQKIHAKHKKFYSCYFETGSRNVSGNYLRKEDDDRFLRESGYDYFPVLCPRWEITGEDVYGTDCPGMTVIGDVRQLQLGEKRSMQAIDKMVNPPMAGPTSMRNVKASVLPGDITYVDERDGSKGFRPIHEVNPRIAELEEKQSQLRDRIRRGFYEDLFLMLANTQRSGITAREIDERHEEKLLALGPVLEQLNQDLLDPLIDNSFVIMQKHGIMPEPPEELQGIDLKVEYISVMAQAQKLVSVGSLERFAGFLMQTAQVNPAVLDKVDSDQMIDVYADITSVPPGVVRSDEAVEALRQSREKQAQAQAQMEMLNQGTQAAKNLASADMGGDNALSRIFDPAAMSMPEEV